MPVRKPGEKAYTFSIKRFGSIEVYEYVGFAWDENGKVLLPSCRDSSKMLFSVWPCGPQTLGGHKGVWSSRTQVNSTRTQPSQLVPKMRFNSYPGLQRLI